MELVPLFKDMNERLLDDICERLKPCLFTSNTYIIEEGDPVDQMLFIVRGCLEITTAYGWSSGFLEEGDYCCEELLTWALDPKSGANIPSSGRTLRALKDVEAFALPADEIKFVVSQFRRQRPRQVQHAFRFFSQNWRTWAACFIQAAWRTYHNAGGGGRTSYSLSNHKRLMKLGKFSYSNFTDDTDYKLVPSGSGLYSQEYRTWAACVIQASWRTYSKRKVLLQQLNDEVKLLRGPYNSKAGRFVTLSDFR